MRGLDYTNPQYTNNNTADTYTVIKNGVLIGCTRYYGSICINNNEIFRGYNSGDDYYTVFFPVSKDDIITIRTGYFRVFSYL